MAPADELVEGELQLESSETLDEVKPANEHLWGLALVVPLAVAAYFWGASRRRKALAGLGNHALLGKLVATVNPGARLVKAIFATASLALIWAGLMRVQYGGDAEVVPASGLDVVLVVDYSKSMLARDVYPSRTERLEAELFRFIDDADDRGDRVGVVVFAGRPRGFPLTRDTGILKLYLDRADPRTENPGGTAIGRGLRLALTFLVDARISEEDVEEGEEEREKTKGGTIDIPPPENDQAIILLTDGEDTDSRPLEVAQEAQKLGVHVYTVGIGSRSGEPVQRFNAQGEPDGFATDEDGNYVMTRLDEELLGEVATLTGGEYIRIDPESFSLDEVRAKLEDRSRSQRKDKVRIDRDEAYPFFVVPALVLLLLSLAVPDRRRRAG